MPQDGPRSVVYRSFFSCEDPKGVAECKTNRKSKTDSHKLDEKVVHPKKQKNLSRSLSWNGERNDIISKRPVNGELHNPSTFQLMQISRGAEKLNQVIDTWSKDISLEKHSKDIAENLLKGALDLKESLAMLGKLQEASQVMAKLKKKQKDKGGGGKLDSAGIERTMSDRFGYASQRTMEFENPRYSGDGSARDCFEELREVIKESFARQNLLPKSYNEEKPYCDRRKSESLLPPSSPDMLLMPRSFKEERAYFDRSKSEFSWDPSYQNHKLTKFSKEEKAKSDFSQDLPSTSSSQSSHFFSYEFDSSDSSVSKSLEMKPKAPNVIAKLMGLEDVSPKRLQTHPKKHNGKDKGLNQGRTIFDIDLPKARRPPFTVHKLDSQPRTLEELTETIQFKGLVSSKSPGQFEHLSEISDWRKGFASDVPPIVIIKPLHVPELMEEALNRPRHKDIDSKKILRNRKMENELPPRPKNDREGAQKSTGKARAEKSPGKRPFQEKADKDYGDAVARKDDKSTKRQENPPSPKIKASGPVKPKNQKKEVSQKTINRNRKVVPASNKPTEVGNKKSGDISESLQPNKLKSASPRKPEREPNFSNVEVPQDKGTTPDTMAECFVASDSSTGQKTNVKKETQLSEPSEFLVESEIRSNDVPVEPASQSVPDVVAKLIDPSLHITGGEELDISEHIGNCNKSTNHVGDSLLTLLPNSEVKTNEGANSGVDFYVTEKKRHEKSSTKNILLGNTSFLNLAEELFDINSHQSTYSHTTRLQDCGTADSQVLLECAKELLENKRLQCTFGVHPMSNILFKEFKIWIPLDQLVNEICDGIEYLRSYCKLGDKGLLVHKLHTVLQKDMWGKGVVNGAWDLGWSKGFVTPDVIHQVVVNIEESILTDLIEDMLRDMAV